MKLAHAIPKHKWLILLLASLLAVPATIGMMHTKINYDILTYLPQDLESTEGQSIMDETFHNAATSMLILKDTKSSTVLSIKDEISKIQGVRRVLWRDDILDVTTPKEMMPQGLRDAFYQEDSTLLFVQFESSSSSDETQEAIAAIRDLLDHHESYLGGMSAIIKDTKDLINHETPIYVSIAVVLSLIILSLTNKSTIIPILYLVSIGFAILYNMGTNIFLGSISYVTKAIAAVLQLAVTMDYSIFLSHRYEEERLKYPDDHEHAMGEAIHKTASSIAGSSITTIAGFLALIAMELTLGKDIGLVMAKGVLFGLLTTVTILPALIVVFDKAIHRFSHRVLLPSFTKLPKMLTKHYVIFFLIFLLLFVPAIFGSRQVEEYYNLDRSLPADLPSVVSTKMLKEDYDMASTHFLMLNASTPPYKVSELSKEIQNMPGISSVLSGEDLVGVLLPQEYLPDELMENFKKDGYELMMIQSEYKTASDEVAKQIDDIKAAAKEVDQTSILTGESVLTKDLTLLADSDFKRVNFISIAVVFLILLILYRSLSLPVILIVAIELAILINMSLSYYFSQTIPFVASIVIGTIQLGSTIDYSILLTTRYLEELRVAEPKEAMSIALQESAKSILTSALSFIAATAGVAVYSNMEIVSVMCGMMARGAFISMLVILLLLPSLLLVLHPIIIRTSLGLKKTLYRKES